MNPAIVIPTFWADAEHLEGVYDHATLVGSMEPDLERCLDSLEQVRGVIRTFLLLVAPPEVESLARRQVDAIAEAHPRLSPLVVGSPEAAIVREAMEEAAPTMPGDCVSLRGYGAIRNLGLAVSAIFGHDVCVFIDDDEVVLDDQFLLDAVYALGQLTRQGEPVVAKSGFFLNQHDSAYADENVAWYDRHWNKHAEFNQWMRKAMSGARISRSNHVCGGCMAIHAEAFTRVAFDPYITRGEDLDYLINMRFYGLDVWFDNRWRVKHLPPGTTAPAKRFAQNVYRWIYERAKLQFAASIIGFNRVTPSSLMPYPGRWMAPTIDDRARRTAFSRAVGTREHRAYFEIWRHGIEDARRNAEATKRSYLAFQTWWPALMQKLWDRRDLGLELLATGVPRGIREQTPPDATAVIMPGAEEESGLWTEPELEETIALQDVDEHVVDAVDSAVEPVASTVSEEVAAETLVDGAPDPLAQEVFDPLAPIAAAEPPGALEDDRALREASTEVAEAVELVDAVEAGESEASGASEGDGDEPGDPDGSEPSGDGDPG